jgi:uncharacterized lipoprotein YddW (UPF0748 family)
LGYPSAITENGGTMRRLAAWLFTTALFVSPLFARTEYRAFWVDTFNTTLNNHTDIVNVVNNAKAAKANAILAQVRRRGDSWYLNSLEPLLDFNNFSPAAFDPLQDLIATAHAEGIEVHAFCIIGAVWNKNPTFAPTATLGPPTNPNHVFNLHGGYDPVSKTIIPGPNNWLTRSLIPDGTGGITFQGHRFGSDFWIDLGHPDAAEYTYNVLMQLIRNYDIDGLHFDRIRYPELSVSGQTPSTGTSIGYNPTSIERFQRHYGIPVGSPPPAQNNAQWSQWRRDQVTNLVRRVYLNAIAVKPQIKISAALIAFGQGPTDVAPWPTAAEAYWRVYQDWRAWTEEGILDIAMPMAYKAENINTGPPSVNQQTQFNQWLAWLNTHQYNRAGVIGIGGLSNAIEGTLRQTRRSLATPNNLAGVIFFSMATSNVAITSNPYAIPPGATPARPFAEFASGLTTGKSISGATLYEPAVDAANPIFAEAAAIPVFAWKSAPTKGHLMGFAKRPDGTAIDTGAVTVINADTNAVVRTTTTDGNGFFGVVDLTPGRYTVNIEAPATASSVVSAAAVIQPTATYSSNCIADVIGGNVSRADAAPPQLVATDVNVSTTPGSCSAALIPPPPEVIGICGAYSVTSSRSDSAALTAPYPKGVTTVTWSLTDSTGLNLTAIQKVTVIQIPQITAPANKTATTDAGACSAVLNPGMATSTNCPGYSISGTRSDGAALTAPYPKGVTTITWTITEFGGFTASATQRITITDNEAPKIFAPSDVETATDPGVCSAIVSTGTASASDNCPNFTIAGTRSDGAVLNAAYPKGVTTITWKVTDAAGLTATAVQRITVNDVERPRITAPADVTAPTVPGSCAALVNIGLPTALDNCAMSSVIGTRSDGAALAAVYPKGVTTITWAATDSSGLIASATQRIIVNDVEPPQITAPADVQASTDHGDCSALVNPGMPAASDNCPGYSFVGARSDGAPLDAAYPKGTTTITWTVTDAAGLTASSVQKINVADNEPPHIAAPADVHAVTDAGLCSAIVIPGTATASDNCPGSSIHATRSDGQPLASPFPKGLTTITWSVTDAAGLTASAVQNVVVNDVEAPAISKVKADKKELWPANHKMEIVNVSYATSDNCAGLVTTSLSVSSNEAIDGLGDGDTSPDWEVISDHEVALRAERSALGSGRVYTIMITANDADGNQSTATTTVSVPLNQGHGD